MLARGGSKRLPGKNIKLFNGTPMIGYGIKAAKGSQYIDKVIVSTDDDEIARVAREQGAEVPFIRPAELASDTATVIATLQHAVEQVEADGERFDLIVLIQPTSPGVLSQDVDAAIEKLESSGMNSCVSVCEITDRPEIMYRLAHNGCITPYVAGAGWRSQDMQELFRLNGAVYVAKHDTLMEGGKIYDNDSCVAVVMPRERSVDVDTAFDFAVAETMMKEVS